jgi:hypothetical protein
MPVHCKPRRKRSALATLVGDYIRNYTESKKKAAPLFGKRGL